MCKILILSSHLDVLFLRSGSINKDKKSQCIKNKFINIIIFIKYYCLFYVILYLIIIIFMLKMSVVKMINILILFVI